jgi:hypothetical protein
MNYLGRVEVEEDLRFVNLNLLNFSLLRFPCLSRKDVQMIDHIHLHASSRIISAFIVLAHSVVGILVQPFAHALLVISAHSAILHYFDCAVFQTRSSLCSVIKYRHLNIFVANCNCTCNRIVIFSRFAVILV